MPDEETPLPRPSPPRLDARGHYRSSRSPAAIGQQDTRVRYRADAAQTPLVTTGIYFSPSCSSAEQDSPPGGWSVFPSPRSGLQRPRPHLSDPTSRPWAERLSPPTSSVRSALTEPARHLDFPKPLLPSRLCFERGNLGLRRLFLVRIRPSKSIGRPIGTDLMSLTTIPHRRRTDPNSRGLVAILG
jgi:hypothetical protein